MIHRRLFPALVPFLTLAWTGCGAGTCGWPSGLRAVDGTPICRNVAYELI